MKNYNFQLSSDVNRNFVSDLESVFKKHPNHDYHVEINSNITRFESWIHDINDIKPILNSKVLSSGCGTAGDLFYFLKYSPKKAIGIETNSDYVKLARSRLSIFPKHKWGIDLYDGGKLPYKDNSFDIIFSMHVLEHVENPTQYIMELFRVLNRGGICFIELPNRYYPIEQHTSKPLVHWPSMKTRFIIQQISKKLSEYKLKLLGEKNGFRALKVIRRGNSVSTLMQLYNSVALSAPTKYLSVFLLIPIMPIQLLFGLFKSFLHTKNGNIFIGYTILFMKNAEK